MSKRRANLAIIRAWADDATGYESCGLVSFYHTCTNPNIRRDCEVEGEPSPRGALYWAEREEVAASSPHAAMAVELRACAETFRALAAKLHDLPEGEEP